MIGPLLETLQPEVVVEVGSGRGQLTEPLLRWAHAGGATLHAIDPRPLAQEVEWAEQWPNTLTFHADRSLNALARITEVDVALLGGDPNWYTVSHELALLELMAQSADCPLPVVVIHGVDGPHRRRDGYYEPSAVPGAHRFPYEPADESLDGDDDPASAIYEHSLRNGVRTALEDFLADRADQWVLREVPGDDGLAVLAPSAVVSEHDALTELLERLQSASFLRGRVATVESARTEAERARAVAERRDVQSTYALRGLDEQQAELAESLHSTHQRLEQAEAQRGQLQEANESLRAELEYVRSTAEASERGIAELRGTIGDLQRQQHAGDDERDRLRDSLARSEAAEGRLRQALAEAQDVARASREHALEQGARVTELEDLGGRLPLLEDALAQARSSVEQESRIVYELREALVGQSREAHAHWRERLVAEHSAFSSAPRALLTPREPVEHPPRAETVRPIPPAHDPPPPSGAVPPAPGHAESAPDLKYSPVDGSAPSADATARAWFRAQHASALGTDVDDTEALARLAQPACRNLRRVVEEEGARKAPAQPTVDIVVCVHDALEDVRRCLWSLSAKTDYPFRLIVVNDGSGPPTTRDLELLAAENSEVTLIHNLSPPHGYTIAANLGMRATSADYVVLLNSDTIVTPGWLKRIVACGEKHPDAGVLGPLSNAASHQSVPELRQEGRWATNELPEWMTEDAMGELVACLSERRHPSLPFINGFCYAIKRKVLDRIGAFDEEHFASGYCEENDFSLRAAAAGFRLAVVDDAYVFHAKSRSYTPAGRDGHAKRNYQILLDKHGPDNVNRLVRDAEASEALTPLRGSLRSAIGRPEDLASALHRGRRPLSVVFVLPGLGKGGSGGSHSIVQEVRGLRRLGVPARIALVKKDIERARSTYPDAGELFEPFADVDELERRTADADVISMTHFKSAAMVAHIWAQRQDFLPAYYIQDYEPFFSTSDGADIAEAVASYTAIPEAVLFAKTHWLCNVVGQAHGLAVAKVEPSIDETLFWSGSRPGGGPLRVAAMTRPRTPRRQAHGTVTVLERAAARLGADIETVTFGCEAAAFNKLTSSSDLRAGHRGLLDRQEVAALLGSVDVFLDLSVYQAFGRTALEAMACGATAVVPRVGGASEFAVHGENSLVVDTFDEEPAVQALCDLAADRDRLAALQSAARRDAGRYSITRAALSEYLLFTREHARRFEPRSTVLRRAGG
ncbi:MAG: glycosyltransferase [Solirubrobacteraceae bacterium MAG38_C4-C5]|nr:glycosyltransferase [Candidatus Siliceabacter maunaloa]